HWPIRSNVHDAPFPVQLLLHQLRLHGLSLHPAPESKFHFLPGKIFFVLRIWCVKSFQKRPLRLTLKGFFLFLQFLIEDGSNWHLTNSESICFFPDLLCTCIRHRWSRNTYFVNGR